MTSESILNLLWAALSLILGVLGALELRRSYGRWSQARLRRDFALLIIIVALFFCVSASDDMIRMQALLNRSSHKPVSGLARLLDLQEDLQVGSVYQFVPALYLQAVLALLNKLTPRSFLTSPSGRSPPLLPAVC